MDRMKSFKMNGCTGLIVSHAPQAILTMCDDAIWLDHGRVVAFGPAADVVGQYVEATGTARKMPETPTMPPEGAAVSSSIEQRLPEAAVPAVSAVADEPDSAA